MCVNLIVGVLCKVFIFGNLRMTLLLKCWELWWVHLNFFILFTLIVFGAYGLSHIIILLLFLFWVSSGVLGLYFFWLLLLESVTSLLFCFDLILYGKFEFMGGSWKNQEKKVKILNLFLVRNWKAIFFFLHSVLRIMFCFNKLISHIPFFLCLVLIEGVITLVCFCVDWSSFFPNTCS